jgi:hypothetical protein
VAAIFLQYDTRISTEEDGAASAIIYMSSTKQSNALLAYPTYRRNIMKIFKATTFAALMLASLAAQAGQPIINLSVGGELAPGVYGEVQFGNAPPPPVVYAQPRIIVRQPREVELVPMYLAVPPRHARNWRRYCREYDACGRQVFFVKSEEYEPGYREHGRKRGHDHRDHEDEGNRGEGRGDRGDRHGDKGDHERGGEGGDRGEHRGDKHRD